MQNIDSIIAEISKRALPEGGFSQKPDGELSPEASAWSILALCARGRQIDLIEAACRRLSKLQRPDGRLPIIEGMDTVHWPTALALLAWKKTGGFEAEIEKAARFLLEARGLHFPAEKEAPYGHDTSIHGWPWIEETHSWIEPTSLAVLALRTAGYSEHARVREAVRMILDRQLPSGGWNFGNTTIFNRELLPMPENTGQALCALGGMVDYSDVKRSVDYAADKLKQITTPFSLSWCVFGLGAWSARLDGVQEQVERVFSLQGRYGPYGTSLIAQLALAHHLQGDFLHFILG